MKKSIKNAGRIDSLALMPYSLIHDNTELFTEKMSNGCDFRFLICKPNSEASKELYEMIEGTSEGFDNKKKMIINKLKNIEMQAKKENIKANGTIEVREYNTELRMPITICYDKKDKKKYQAFQTIWVPPRQSINCMMIEYKNSQCDDLIKHFEFIWQKYENAVVYKSN